MSGMDGLDRLRRKIAALPPVVRAAGRQALDQQSADLAALQARAVPVDKGSLRESIERRWGRTDLTILVMAGGPKTTRPVRNGTSVTYDYALAQEFGTEKMPANPFFYPSYRLLKKRMKAAVAKALRDSVRQTMTGGQ